MSTKHAAMGVAPRRDGTVGRMYLCGKTALGRWLAFGMGPNVKSPEECKNR